MPHVGTKYYKKSAARRVEYFTGDGGVNVECLTKPRRFYVGLVRLDGVLTMQIRLT
jgi:hypothetical protein